MTKRKKETRADCIAREVASAVGAGRQHSIETVDFSDPQRPLTCLEVDFPIIPINQVAVVEGSARKPIYQMSKWWARRRSSVFRSILISAAMKAPDDPSEAAKAVWNVYYGNHQKRGSLGKLRVADIFMGGGTTLVEGGRLGMQMFGNDLNPVAWFVVNNALAQIDKEEVQALISRIESEVRPEILPFYACGCPRGHTGQWLHIETDEVMKEDFDPTTLPPEERRHYSYRGPEIVYAFWAKHGPCQTTGCGHRTPILATPVIAVKTLSINHWKRKCSACGSEFDIEERDARMAPSAPLVCVDDEDPYAVAELDEWTGAPASVRCPHCSSCERLGVLPKAKKKKVKLSLLIHPDWLRGEAGSSPDGSNYGGSVRSHLDATLSWNQARAKKCRLLEVRGPLPAQVTCPDTGVSVLTGSDGGTVPARGQFCCGSCGTSQSVLSAAESFGDTCPEALYAVQGFCPTCKEEGAAYGGRFFIAGEDSHLIDRACREWELRSESEFSEYLPSESVPAGLETEKRTALHRYGYRRWRDFFNARQLLGLCSLSRFICAQGARYKSAALFISGAFQQYLRNNNMFCIWNIQADKLEPFLSKNNLQPPTRPIENALSSKLGRGNWASCADSLAVTMNWSADPWERVATSSLPEALKEKIGSAKSLKVFPGDRVRAPQALDCGSSTELKDWQSGTFDLVITDPPFGSIMQYSELSGFFYGWIRRIAQALGIPHFEAEHPPTALEAVENPQRHGTDSADFYRRLLTSCWIRAHELLADGGILAFTFHHDDDAPWVAVLQSLFDAGFILEATYPIRSDETKGEGGTPGTFGAQKVEYDIIHVCRKRVERPQAISWAKMRRQVLQDVRRLQELLEHHSEEGLPEADLQVIRRGKALEYFSRHYGQVFKDEHAPITVREALVGINQLLDEESSGSSEPPPHAAEPFTRMFLRLFDGRASLPRDQLQKHLRGTGTAPSDFVGRGWCFEKDKIFRITSPLEIVSEMQGKHRKGITSDYDQAAFLIGACFEGSGINASDTLNNANFKPHPALGSLLTWLRTHGATEEIRDAASVAMQIFRTWESKQQTPKMKQALLFFGEEDV